MKKIHDHYVLFVVTNLQMRACAQTNYIFKKYFELKEKTVEFFKRMLGKLKSGEKTIKCYIKVNEKSLYASYLINLRIAKAGSPHTIGEMLVFQL